MLLNRSNNGCKTCASTHVTPAMCTRYLACLGVLYTTAKMNIKYDRAIKQQRFCSQPDERTVNTILGIVCLQSEKEHKEKHWFGDITGFDFNSSILLGHRYIYPLCCIFSLSSNRCSMDQLWRSKTYSLSYGGVRRYQTLQRWIRKMIALTDGVNEWTLLFHVVCFNKCVYVQ